MDQASSNEFRTRKTKRAEIKRVAAHDCEDCVVKLLSQGLVLSVIEAYRW